MRCLNGCVKRIRVPLLRASHPLVAGALSLDHPPLRSPSTAARVRRVFQPHPQAMAPLDPAGNMATERLQCRAMGAVACRRASLSHHRLHTGRCRRLVHPPAR